MIRIRNVSAGVSISENCLQWCRTAVINYSPLQSYIKLPENQNFFFSQIVQAFHKLGFAFSDFTNSEKRKGDEAFEFVRFVDSRRLIVCFSEEGDVALISHPVAIFSSSEFICQHRSQRHRGALYAGIVAITRVACIVGKA